MQARTERAKSDESLNSANSLHSPDSNNSRKASHRYENPYLNDEASNSRTSHTSRRSSDEEFPPQKRRNSKGRNTSKQAAGPKKSPHNAPKTASIKFGDAYTHYDDEKASSKKDDSRDSKKSGNKATRHYPMQKFYLKYGVAKKHRKQVDTSKGRPVQILKFDADHKFVLDIPALGEILLNDVVRRTPLVVLSIAGDFRKGKSFLLNHFLEYFRKGCDTNKWLMDMDKPLTGFSWRGGSERDTSGILMWSKPFIVKDSNNRDLAVILMDTQGAFDNEFTFKDSALVFALSTMTSSIQVFNLMHNLQDDDLQVLEFFSEYGRLAMEEVDEKPFQKLMFLIRDWPYPYEHQYGFLGGSAFLEKRLTVNENMPEELQRARKRICECFQDIGCFLMPHPGPIVATQASFDGRARDYDKEFLALLREFVPNLLHPSRLVSKKIAGREITGWELMEYFKTYAEIFESDDMPEPKNLFDATAEANNLTAMRKAYDMYVKNMNAVCSGRNYINPQRLLELHNKIQHECLQEFDDTLKIGGAEYSGKYRDKLYVDVENVFEQFQNQNKCKNFFGVFGTPFIILLISAKLYAVSSLLGMLGIEQYSKTFSSFSILGVITALTYMLVQYSGNYPELLLFIDNIAENIWNLFDQYVIGKMLREPLVPPPTEGSTRQPKSISKRSQNSKSSKKKKGAKVASL